MPIKHKGAIQIISMFSYMFCHDHFIISIQRVTWVKKFYELFMEMKTITFSSHKHHPRTAEEKRAPNFHRTCSMASYPDTAR